MHPNTIIQNYRLLSKLGEGGMGEVWLAEHVTIARKVAIKILHAHYSRNADLRARFRNEAVTLSKLQHPNIVAFYDLIEADEHICLVMEYVKGRNLDEIIRWETGPLTPGRLGAIFKQILLAFDHAHRAGVIHRDIKPSNFMLTDDGTLKVLDFGIAKLLADDQQLTRTGTRMGTTFYMSPEQVDGGKVDQRSDIYSLGVTLFVLATGKNPYEGETVEFKVYSRIVQEPLPLASSVYPGVTAAVDRLIQRATAKDPNARFQSCGEFLVGESGAAVPAPAASGGAVLPPPDGTPNSLVRFKSLRRLVLIGTVAGILLCWVPATGSGISLGSLPGFGFLASIGITVASIAMRRGHAWSMWGLRIFLAVFGLASLLAAFFPRATSFSSSSSYSFSVNGSSLSESMTDDYWPLKLVCGLAFLFAAWGLWVLFDKKNEPYLLGLH